MILDLLGQLVSSSTLDLPVPANNSKISFAEARDALRSCIIKQTQVEPVFCFIDSVTQYTNDAHAHDIHGLLSALGGLATSTQRQPCDFKLLVTSPTCYDRVMLVKGVVEAFHVP